MAKSVASTQKTFQTVLPAAVSATGVDHLVNMAAIIPIFLVTEEHTAQPDIPHDLCLCHHKIVEAFHDPQNDINSGLRVIITLLHTQVMELKTTYLCIRTLFHVHCKWSSTFSEVTVGSGSLEQQTLASGIDYGLIGTAEITDWKLSVVSKSFAYFIQAGLSIVILLYITNLDIVIYPQYWNIFHLTLTNIW